MENLNAMKTKEASSVAVKIRNHYTTPLEGPSKWLETLMVSIPT